MTDRIRSFIVVLEKDLREDDAQALVIAMRQLRGVLTVTPQVADYADVVANARARSEIGQRLMEVLYPPEQK